MEQIESAGEVMRASIGRMDMAAPALSGCPRCGTVQMIAAPMLGLCEACGGELAIWPAERLMPCADRAGATPERDAA
jgi:hypothetical protein